MKRYEFRLAAVLRLRRAEEEQARVAVANANAALRRLLVERDRDERHYRELAGTAVAETPETLAEERQQAKLAADKLAAAEEKVAQAATEAAVAQVSWVRAHRQVEILERLEARRRSEHADAVRREDAALLDELATARFSATAAEPGGRAS